MPRAPVPAVILALATVAAACTDAPDPAWRIACDTDTQYQRTDACKEACGAEALCRWADQPTCEAECRACAPDVAWCPAE